MPLQDILHAKIDFFSGRETVMRRLTMLLKVTYHPLYSLNKFVTNKSKLPPDRAQVFPYMEWLAIMWPSDRVTWYPITPYKDIIIHTI